MALTCCLSLHEQSVRELCGHPTGYEQGKMTRRKVSWAIVDDDLILDQKKQMLHTDVMHIDSNMFLVTLCKPLYSETIYNGQITLWSIGVSLILGCSFCNNAAGSSAFMGLMPQIFCLSQWHRCTPMRWFRFREQRRQESGGWSWRGYTNLV